MTEKQILTLAPKAVKRRMPKSVEPMKAVLVDDPFEQEGWVFETKYDGIRTICILKDGAITLYSRNQKEMTFRYPELRDIPKRIGAAQAVLDGEIVVLDKNGNVSFSQLQSRFGLEDRAVLKHLEATQKIVFYVFDILWIDGYNVTECSLLSRKTILKKILKENAVLKYSGHRSDGLKLFQQAEKSGWEGIMAKNARSPYLEKRSNEWLKIKTQKRQEVVIIGYTAPKGSREYFGALTIGYYKGGVLVNAGHVGSGFGRALLKTLYARMQKYLSDTSPADPSIESTEAEQWLKPRLVGEVRFTEVTKSGTFRHPVFMGLRSDKKPKDCILELEHSAKAQAEQAEAAIAKPASKQKSAARMSERIRSSRVSGKIAKRKRTTKAK